jgi:hypothetical protein
VRLSIDTRAQPATTPRTFQMTRRIPEQRAYRVMVQKLALEQGASQELFEAVVIEMMKRALDANHENVKRVMNDLSGEVTA